jgi:hypothetical protein
MTMIPLNTILTPVLALVAWSLVMWVWMYATRIPAMQKARINPQDAVRTRTLDIPGPAQWPADNYNHLMEQPTIFYALVFYVYLSGAETGLNIALAWGYVGLRVAHSLIQATANIVMARFLVFSLATFCLAAIVVEQAMKLVAY